MGLKTASLSQANVLTVSSRAESSRQYHMARWDLNVLDVKWDLQLLDNKDLLDWERKALGAKVAKILARILLTLTLSDLSSSPEKSTATAP